jgi:CRISPR system Cascade subunit CasB
MSEPTDREHRFAEYLRRLESQDDRAALAALRRGLGKAPGEAAEMYRYVVPWTQDLNRSREQAFYQVAALFAWHQLSWTGEADQSGPRNLGASLRLLAARLSAEKREPASVERHFTALLNSQAEDLGERLRRVVGLLKAHEVPIDWAQLLHDLPRWEWQSREVQRSWARQFWGDDSAQAASAQAEADDPVGRA